ncbi:hypothetical protein [Methylogaea oryzae]|uniref:Uncharacterized protein n=1 Tax=Methylogaea oryzae TaxID=1295382 RepID=A0A8D4VNA4_9GAMM|nr:hypothetical protein [Methylogaea oryzae]BBL70359.1 hypothetical protein MoryE10_09650 [Methylogaea oryzae]
MDLSTRLRKTAGHATNGALTRLLLDAAEALESLTARPTADERQLRNAVEALAAADECGAIVRTLARGGLGDGHPLTDRLAALAASLAEYADTYQHPLAVDGHTDHRYELV